MGGDLAWVDPQRSNAEHAEHEQWGEDEFVVETGQRC